MGDNGLTEEQKLVLAAYCEKTVPWLEEMYFKKFDTNRQEVLRLYDDNTPIIWNGYRMVGKEGIQNALQQLPSTTHKLETIDCQPIVSPDPNQRFILTTINGTVTYADEICNTFNQVLILRSEGKDLKIVYDCYRWLATS
eukprot:NODE_5962_length_588_cov_254.668113_g5797_i0.p1 GENE.NODE_5962_length_588_cov_254.668113_g5797_i0~~NODE_5962_length_588_cov_254.668113_g5797_i0.p1  ORF type:complete len:140 (+),score=44.88 NODE_5962_length_588_cov_254.668113_g5797_i0:56-475(+)